MPATLNRYKSSLIYRTKPSTVTTEWLMSLLSTSCLLVTPSPGTLPLYHRIYRLLFQLWPPEATFITSFRLTLNRTDGAAKINTLRTPIVDIGQDYIRLQALSLLVSLYHDTDYWILCPIPRFCFRIRPELCSTVKQSSGLIQKVLVLDTVCWKGDAQYG